MNTLASLTAAAPAVATPVQPLVKVVMQTGFDVKVSARGINIQGAEKSGKTVTSATLSSTFPKGKLPAAEPTILKGMVYKMYDPAGIEALTTLNLFPEFRFDLSSVGDWAALIDQEQAVTNQIKSLGAAAEFVVIDSFSILFNIIQNRQLKMAGDNQSALAYPKMVGDIETLWALWRTTGLTHVFLTHLKTAGLFMDKGDAKKIREQRLKAVGLPTSIELTSDLPYGVAKYLRRICSATFMQRKVPGDKGNHRYSLVVDDGVLSDAGSRWAAHFKTPEVAADLGAIVRAVDSKGQVEGMNDKYSITAEDLIQGTTTVRTTNNE